MTSFGQQAYKRVGLDTAVASADPHQMILMLYDGVLEAVRRASAYMQEGKPAEKGQMLGKAIRIVEEGLKASLDRSAGGKLAQQLSALYDYIALRLLQANLRNDANALAEVTRLLDDLRAAWAQIGKSGPAMAALPATLMATANELRPQAGGARTIDGASPAPRRSFAALA
jgi:flagellar protein FliS